MDVHSPAMRREVAVDQIRKKAMNALEREAEDQLAPRIAADMDKRVREWLTSYYGYHQGPSPRVGARVRCQGIQGFVVAHDNAGRVFILLSDGRRAQQKRHETIVIGPRKPLHEAIDVFVSEAIDSLDPLAIAQLVTHFRGDNGARYVNRRSFLWCVHAFCHVLVETQEASDVAAWLNAQLEGEADRDELPMPVEAGFLTQGTSGELDGEALEAAKAVAHQSLLRALELGKESIELTITDKVQDVRSDGSERCLATDLQTERQMVVIGRSAINKAAGYVDVIDMDTLWSFTRHVSGLELGESGLDEGWFWDVVTQTVLKHPTSVAAVWFADTMRGPDGTEVDLPERRRVAALGSLLGLRFAVGQGARGVTKRMIRQAKEQARSLGKEEFSRLAALAPELVAPAVQGSFRLSRLETLAIPMQDAMRQLLKVLPPPEVQAPAAPTATLVSDIASTLDVLSVAQTAIPVARPEKIQFVRTAQPLRFNVTDHPLLAMEWQLVEEPGAHATAVATALDWLEGRLGTSLPSTWREGAHEIERAGVTVQVESARNLFAFRMDHPDTDHPTRWWRVEATVLSGHHDVGGMVGVRMMVRDFVDLPPPHPSVPALVRAWAGAPGLLLAGARGGRVTFVGSADEFERVIRIVGRDDRETPVLVTAAGGVRLPLQGPLAGLARVLVVSPQVEGYAAIYGPLTANTVHIFGPRTKRPEAFTATGDRWLEQLRLRVMELRQNPETPSFRDVRDTIHVHRLSRLNTALETAESLRADIARVPSQESAGVVETTAAEHQSESETHSQPVAVEIEADQEPVMSVADIRQLVRREISDYEELLELAELERNDALVARDQFQAEAMALRHYVDHLETRLSTGVARVEADPHTLEQLRDWASSVAPRIVFAEKALRNAADCEHYEVPKIYAALRALRDLYWPMRFSTDDETRERAHREWEQFLKLQRLRWTRVGMAAQTGRYQDEYRATLDGITYVSSMHVAGNSATDPLRCLRIYVDVDQDRERIVVVHLPTHLTNTLT